MCRALPVWWGLCRGSRSIELVSPSAFARLGSLCFHRKLSSGFHGEGAFYDEKLRKCVRELGGDRGRRGCGAEAQVQLAAAALGWLQLGCTCRKETCSVGEGIWPWGALPSQRPGSSSAGPIPMPSSGAGCGPCAWPSGRLFGLCDREDELYRSAARIFPELQSPFSFCKFESEVTALMSAARHGRIQAAEHSVLVGSESLRWILPLSASGRLLNCCSRTQQSQPTAEVSEALMHFGQLPSMGDLRHERN